nr:MAG TPA: hypothetical protein [Caudoviricetes sp.]
MIRKCSKMSFESSWTSTTASLMSNVIRCFPMPIFSHHPSSQKRRHVKRHQLHGRLLLQECLWQRSRLAQRSC